MEKSEILKEIDLTLDQLIKNAAALTEISSDPLYQSEIEALTKTQESLLARLLHLDTHLKAKPKPAINQKLAILSNLNSRLPKKTRPSPSQL